MHRPKAHSGAPHHTHSARGGRAASGDDFLAKGKESQREGKIPGSKIHAAGKAGHASPEMPTTPPPDAGMYTLSEKDLEHDDNKRFTAGADFQGPIKRRSCTDPLFLLLLLGAWGVMCWIGREALLGGHVEVLTRGYDWEGKVCDGERPYFMPLNIKTMGVCLPACPTTYDPDTVYCIGHVAPTQANIEAGYCLPQYPTKKVVNRCYITNTTALELYDMVKVYKDQVDTTYLTEFYGDVLTARAYIFGIGFGAALLLGFLWTFFLRAPGLIFVAVWTVNLLVFLFLGALGALMYKFAEEWNSEVPQTHSRRQVLGAKGLAITFMVACALWLCVLVFLRRRINLAIGLVKEAASAVIAMPLLMVYPFLQAAGFVAFLVPWCVFSVSVASLGHFEARLFDGIGLDPLNQNPVITVQRFQYGSRGAEYAWYMLFVLFWTAQFIVAVGQITLALAVSTWYFTRDKARIGSGTLCHAIGVTSRYHLGTAAFGSLVIAIVEIIRAGVAYLQKKAKQSESKFAQGVLCCCQCCMWCLENVLKFVNKNAYIQTAVNGTAFCASGKKAFFLIARNILRIGAVSLVSEFVIIIGKVFVSVLAGGLSYYAMNHFLKDQIRSPIAPTILVVILAWFTANMFCQIFSMAVATLLQAFIADEEMFGPEDRYAAPELSKYIDENGAHDAHLVARRAHHEDDNDRAARGKKGNGGNGGGGDGGKGPEIIIAKVAV